jgi:hypothetical protein
MTIELDHFENRTRCKLLRATSGGTVFSSNISQSSSFDYFNDSAVVNDALYFSSEYSGSSPFNGLKFNVGTALSASAITIVWEYYSTSNVWTALSGVVDNTNNFTTTGVNEVTWDVPTDAKRTTYDGQAAYWIRCRISSVTSITEGGANATDLVQWKMFDIRITGGTTETPITMEDIYQEDVSNGWGVVTKAGDAYNIQRNFFIGDGSTETHFKSTNEAVIVDGQCTINGSTTTVEFGNLIDEENKEVQDGSFFKMTFYYLMKSHFQKVSIENATINAYDSHFIGWGSDGYFNKLYCCTVENSGQLINQSFSDYYRINIYNTSTALWPRNGTVEDINCNGVEYPARFYNSSAYNGVTVDLRNIVSLGNTYAFIWLAGSAATAITTVRLIDCLFDSWDIRWVDATIQNATITQSYSFNIEVLDEANNPIQNATVKLVDKNGDTVFSETTDSNGSIAEQIVNAYEYTRESGNNPGVTAVNTLTPFTITISKSGYKTYKSKFTLNKKFDEIITLSKVKDLNFSKNVIIKTQ